MNNLKVFRVMEWFWLAFTIFMAIWSIYLFITASLDAVRAPLFGMLCGAILYALRRYQRKKVESRMKGQ
jgi:uncharacterized membrane-anchored protein